MRFVLLALLARGPVHGYELKRICDRLFASVWGPMNVGQIYVTMGRLERDGLVTVQVEPTEGRKLYELTELGAKELDRWIGAPDDPVHKSDVVLRLTAASLHSPDALDAVLGDHRAQSLASLRDLDERGNAAPEGSFEELLIRHAMMHLEAELRWLDLADERRSTGPITVDGPRGATQGPSAATSAAAAAAVRPPKPGRSGRR